MCAVLLPADTGVSVCDLDLELVRLTGDLNVDWFSEFMLSLSSCVCGGSGRGGLVLELLLDDCLLLGDKGVMASL